MAEMETIKETVRVHQDRIEHLKAGIEKINRRAVKLGCDPMVLTFDSETKAQTFVMRDGQHIDEESIHRFPAHRIKYVFFTIEATLEYIIPVIDGWELISVFDVAPRMPVMDGDKVKLDADGNTVYTDPMVFTSTVPGKVLPIYFTEKTEIGCDHCGHNRFRTHSMLMRNVANGEYKEVGSTCVKDFFGHDPKGLLWMAQLSFESIVNEINEDFGYGRGEYVMFLDTVMQYTALAIRLDGWVSRKYAREYEKASTVANMYFYMDPPKNYKGKVEVPSEEDIKLAADTIEYFKRPSMENGNDYMANCCKLVKLGVVPNKMVGVACSMIASYKEYYKDYLERQDRPESNWVGEVGDKVEVDVMCLFSKEIGTDYGTSVLYIFVDEMTGNKFKTFYSGSKWTVYQGDTLTLKGTVKRHEEFKDEKNTNLTRCSVTNVVEAPEEENVKAA